MSELNYNLFHLRTAENIKAELIKLREIIIKNFFIDLSDYVVVNKSNKQNFVGFVT